jgi:hypothetical protein
LITCYQDFLDKLFKVGFSMGGGNDEGILSIISWSWNETPPYATPVRWHTGDRETDPWEWRMRVLEERNDVAYSKLFFKKSGYITAEWLPYFLAARRKGQDFEEAYLDGTISHEAKQIFDVILEHGAVPLHTLKALSGLNGKEYKSRFDAALTELQTRMFITMCARKQKQSQSGEEYGWFSTVFCTEEQFFSKSVFEKAASLQPEAAAEAIRKQILRFNPQADTKKIQKFILG